MNGAVWFLSGAAGASAVYALLWFLARKRRQKRLLSLSAYLEAASCGRETALARTEDEFSLLEDEIYKTVGELRIAREQELLQRRRLADNLADIAHQLKTPLTSMLLMTQLLSAEAQQEQLEYTERIDSQLTRLVWLTDSLLTMSRLDAGAIQFASVSLTFEELCARALEPMEQALSARSQAVSVRGQETAFSCDPHWTAEALLNLIKNCSEHTPDGGQIVLEAAATPLYLQIIVEDNGPGFDPAELPRRSAVFSAAKTAAPTA